MPLRDHFRSPLDDKFSWDGFHGGWPMMIVQHMNRVLPLTYFAIPTVHVGSMFEIDIGTLRDDKTETTYEADSDGGLAITTYAPAIPSFAVEPTELGEDVYEVKIYDDRRNRLLVAAIEIVSPANKDRPESRMAMINKCLALLRKNVCVTILDIVTTMNFNLYFDLLAHKSLEDPAMWVSPGHIYAVTLRYRYEGEKRILETWYHPLVLGETLPTLPIWLTANHAIPLELEAGYEETCRTLRMV